MATIGLQALLAALAIPSGIEMVADPSGATLQVHSLLSRLPVPNFAPVGVWLVLVYGALPLAILAGLWWARPWARRATILLSLVEMVWLGAQFVLMYGLGIAAPEVMVTVISVACLGFMFVPSDVAYFARG
jgi:hypothetical protein